MLSNAAFEDYTTLKSPNVMSFENVDEIVEAILDHNTSKGCRLDVRSQLVEHGIAISITHFGDSSIRVIDRSVIVCNCLAFQSARF